MENMYSVKFRLDKEESQNMKRAIGRDWHVVSNYLYEISVKLSKVCGTEINIYPSVVGDITYYIVTIESKSLSALKFADDYLREKVLSNWEE